MAETCVAVKRARKEEPEEEEQQERELPDWDAFSEVGRGELVEAVCGSAGTELMGVDLGAMPVEEVINVPAVRAFVANRIAKREADKKRKRDEEQAEKDAAHAAVCATVEPVLTKFCGPVSNIAVDFQVHHDTDSCDYTNVGIKYEVKFTPVETGMKHVIAVEGTVSICVESTGAITYAYEDEDAREDLLLHNVLDSEEKLLALARELCVVLGIARSAAEHFKPLF